MSDTIQKMLTCACRGRCFNISGLAERCDIYHNFLCTLEDKINIVSFVNHDGIDYFSQNFYIYGYEHIIFSSHGHTVFGRRRDQAKILKILKDPNRKFTILTTSSYLHKILNFLTTNNIPIGFVIADEGDRVDKSHFANFMKCTNFKKLFRFQEFIEPKRRRNIVL